MCYYFRPSLPLNLGEQVSFGHRAGFSSLTLSPFDALPLQEAEVEPAHGEQLVAAALAPLGRAGPLARERRRGVAVEAAPVGLVAALGLHGVCEVPRPSRAGAGEGRQWSKAIVVRA